MTVDQKKFSGKIGFILAAETERFSLRTRKIQQNIEQETVGASAGNCNFAPNFTDVVYNVFFGPRIVRHVGDNFLSPKPCNLIILSIQENLSYANNRSFTITLEFYRIYSVLILLV